MPHGKWREIDLQLPCWLQLTLLGQCLVSLPFPGGVSFEDPVHQPLTQLATSTKCLGFTQPLFWGSPSLTSERTSCCGCSLRNSFCFCCRSRSAGLHLPEPVRAGRLHRRGLQPAGQRPLAHRGPHHPGVPARHCLWSGNKIKITLSSTAYGKISRTCCFTAD